MTTPAIMSRTCQGQTITSQSKWSEQTTTTTIYNTKQSNTINLWSILSVFSLSYSAVAVEQSARGFVLGMQKALMPFQEQVRSQIHVLAKSTSTFMLPMSEAMAISYYKKHLMHILWLEVDVAGLLRALDQISVCKWYNLGTICTR